MLKIGLRSFRFVRWSVYIHLLTCAVKTARFYTNARRNTVDVLVLLSVTLVLSLVIIGAVLYFNKTTKLSNMVPTENSLAFSIWKQSDVLLKIHLFNYTNWQRVRDRLDDRLNVEDVGPYVIKQKTEKVNVKFDGDKLSFQERTTYNKDVPEKTTEQPDEVNVPNLPLIMAVSTIIQSKGQLEEGINEALSRTNHPYAFLKISAERFLWGYPDDICQLAGINNFGLLVETKDSKSSTNFIINTGENDKERLNIFEKVNGRDHLPYWGSPECNSIEGTDGFIFPPTMLDRKTPIYVFDSDLNRRIAFEYERDVEMSGIKLMRYRMQRNAYDDPSTNPANQCYCDKHTGTCSPKGIIDSDAWDEINGLDLMSLPHFSLGDPKLTEDVTGMKPNPALYENYIDLHPTLGIALRGKNSWQLNTKVRKGGDDIRSISFLPDGLILPIAWFSLEFEREDLIPLISSSSRFAPPTKLILVAISIVSLFIGLG